MTMNIESVYEISGSVGLLYDDIPLSTFADVKPFIWATLLFRGGVRPDEVIYSMLHLCNSSERYTDWEDCPQDYCNVPRIQWLVEQTIGQMTAAGILLYDQEKDLWELNLGENDKNLPTIIKAVAGVDGSLPSIIRRKLESSKGWHSKIQESSD